MPLRGSLFQIYTLMVDLVVKKEGGAYKLTCCAAWGGSLFQFYTQTEDFIVKKEGGAYKICHCAEASSRFIR